MTYNINSFRNSIAGSISDYDHKIALGNQRVLSAKSSAMQRAKDLKDEGDNLEKEYKIVDGKKVRRANYGKQLYSSVISLYRYSPKFQDILGDKIVEWNDDFDKIMKKWRADDKKKRELIFVLLHHRRRLHLYLPCLSFLRLCRLP